MSFIAMRSKLWRQLLKVDTPEKLVKKMTHSGSGSVLKNL
jgi:hypothetical protein